MFNCYIVGVRRVYGSLESLFRLGLEINILFLVLFLNSYGIYFVGFYFFRGKICSFKDNWIRR